MWGFTNFDTIKISENKVNTAHMIDLLFWKEEIIKGYINCTYTKLLKKVAKNN